MNVERILALADLIERQPHTELNDKAGFNMEDFNHPCGTPACIAGWALFMAGDEWKRPGRPSLAAADFLGLEIDPAMDLFLWTPGIGLDKITPEQAATTLRYLAETGEVNWRAE